METLLNFLSDCTFAGVCAVAIIFWVMLAVAIALAIINEFKN